MTANAQMYENTDVIIKEGEACFLRFDALLAPFTNGVRRSSFHSQVLV